MGTFYGLDTVREIETLQLKRGSRHVLVIGNNGAKELGSRSKRFEQQLCILDCYANQNGTGYIQNIISGEMFSIYVDNKKTYFAIGHNEFGQCGVGLCTTSINFSPIHHFAKHSIKLFQVCANVAAKTVFWMCSDGKIYGTGCNAKGQLGITEKTSTDIAVPQLIPTLSDKHIMNIQSSAKYAIAVETPIMIAVEGFCRKYINIIADAITHKILNYYSIFHHKYNRVYIAGMDNNMELGWKQLNGLQDTQITRIACGKNHSLFLELNGNLWSYGANHSCQLGVGLLESNSKHTVYSTHFIAHKIKIKSIACGYYHNLAIDYEHKVYSWGYNHYSQCGNDSTKNVKVPQVIESLRMHEIEEIQCGAHHSYVRTNESKHFLFGSNEYNECMAYNGKSKIQLPHCIDTLIAKQTNGGKIVCVSLGVNNTKIIVNRAPIVDFDDLKYCCVSLI